MKNITVNGHHYVATDIVNNQFSVTRTELDSQLVGYGQTGIVQITNDYCSFNAEATILKDDRKMIIEKILGPIALK